MNIDNNCYKLVGISTGCVWGKTYRDCSLFWTKPNRVMRQFFWEKGNVMTRMLAQGQTVNGHIVTVSTWSKAFIGMSTSVLSIHAAKTRFRPKLAAGYKKEYKSTILLWTFNFPESEVWGLQLIACRFFFHMCLFVLVGLLGYMCMPVASHVYFKKPPSPTGLERGLDVIKKYNTHHLWWLHLQQTTLKTRTPHAHEIFQY